MSIVAIGSYHSFLSGWEFEYTEDLQLKSKQLFGFKAGEKCIKTIGISPKYLAIGGTDDLVRLYDITIKREVCTLNQHSGTVTKIVIHENEMICASEDGTLTFYKLTENSVELVNQITVLQKGISDIAIDSTGKICLCIGNKSMRVVDLYRGKVAYRKELDYEAETINWVHNDDYFAISCKNVIHVYNKKFEEFKLLECDKNQMLRVVSSFDNVLIAGTEKGEIITWNFTTEEEMEEEMKREEEQMKKKMEENDNDSDEEEDDDDSDEESDSDSDDEEDFSISEEKQPESVNLNPKENEQKEVKEKKEMKEVKEQKEEENDISDDDEFEEDDEKEMDEIELEYPYKQTLKVKDGRIRGVQQMIVDEWVGYSVGFSDGSFVIIDTEGNVQLEMNTGMRITAMNTISW